MPTPLISPTESKMWETTKAEPERVLTDDEINQKYGKRELRIVTEMPRWRSTAEIVRRVMLPRVKKSACN